jgi:hypothetical protein
MIHKILKFLFLREIEVAPGVFWLGGTLYENRNKPTTTPRPLKFKRKNPQVPMKLTDKQILNLAHSHFEEVYHPPGKYGVYGVFEVSEHQMLTFARALEELAQENPQSGL